MRTHTKIGGRVGWVLVLAIVCLPGYAQEAQERSEPEKPEAQAAQLLAQGQELVGSQDFNEAAAVLKQAVDMDEHNANAWFLLGYALHMDKQLEAALDAHKKAAEFDGSTKAVATYNVGCALTLLGRPAEAMDALRQAVELGYRDADQFRTDPDLFAIQPTTEFAKLLASVEEKSALIEKLDEAQRAIDEENYEDAAKVYREILSEDSENAFACYRLGYALHAAGKLDEAIKYHERATKFPGIRGIAAYNWGCALSLQGKKDSAIAKLKDAVKSGFVRLDAYQNDPDLNNLREESAFRELLAGLEAKTEEKGKAADTAAKSKATTDK